MQRNLSKSRTMNAALMRIVTVICLVGALGISLAFGYYSRSMILKNANERLLSAVEFAHELHGADFHDRITGEDSLSREQFERILDRHDALCRRLDLQYIWSVLVLGDRIIFTTATRSNVNDPASAHALFFETHRDPLSFNAAMGTPDVPVYSSFHNEWGAGRQVLVPRLDSQNRRYITGASIQLDELNNLVMNAVWLALIAGAALFVLVWPLAGRLIRRITGVFSLINTAAVQMAQGDLDIALPASGIAEARQVCDTLDSMRQELKRRMEELRRERERLGSILEGTHVGTWEWNVQTGETIFNERWAEIIGYSLEEISPVSIDTWMKFTHPDDLKASGELLQRYFSGELHYYECEARMRHKNGEWLWVLDRGKVAVWTEDGKPLHMMGTHQDITERKQAENKLRVAHEKMLTILDSIDSTVYVADMDTYEILFMNKKMITDFGGNKIGDICYSSFRKNSKPCECCTNNQLVDKEENSAGVCIWHDKNPVTGRYYINYDRAIEWTDGRLVRMQIATDITDLKKMEAQLLQAQKMESVGRLAGGVAHDFNNMLGVILGHVEFALEKAEQDHDLHANLKEIQTAAKRSANITKQLLAFARKQTISPRQLDLNDTVESMLNMLRRLIGEDIDLVWQPSTHLWPVKMDPTQIDQILANLCVNARDAIAGVGKLTIETGRKTFDEEYCSEHSGFIPGDYVLLTVSDNGCGMNKKTLENLFEPFFTTKEVGKGTGLGLATIYGIVKQNNGFINVYSEPGQGSTFRIYLPRLVAEDAAAKSVPDKKMIAGGTETILIVEDEPAILKLTRMMLKRNGYSVLSATTPAEAIEMVENYTNKIHLLMTDVVMPGMNGRDLARHLITLYPDIKLLFMSGYTANVIAHQGVLDEGVAFIQKPFSMADLAEKLRGVLDEVKSSTRGF